MTMLVLVRNFVPAHEQIISGGWDVAAVAKDSYDLEGKVIGTVGGTNWSASTQAMQALRPHGDALLRLPAHAR
jgi:phosphoglycerate dehydrogenase-like enzyme